MPKRRSMLGSSKKSLRLCLALFFLSLAIPSGILVHQAFGQLKWEAFHQHRVLAEELSSRIDDRFRRLIEKEEARSFTDYSFLNVVGDPAVNFLQRSPLSAFPVTSSVPGLIAYFQVDALGVFSTPLLPPTDLAPQVYGIGEVELNQRLALQTRVRQILSENRLVQSTTDTDSSAGFADTSRPEPHAALPAASALAPADDEDTEEAFAARNQAQAVRKDEQASEALLSQSAFDRLKATLPEEEKQRQAIGKLGRVEDLKLDRSYQSKPQDLLKRELTAAPEKRARKESSALPEQGIMSLAEESYEADAPLRAQAQARVPIRTFESELDPFEFSLLDDEHFVLYRKVWRDGQRFIQGAVIEQQPFLQGVAQSAFDATALSQMSDLIIAYDGNVISAFSGSVSRGYLTSAAELSGALLYQTRLSNPLSNLEMIFSINRLPSGPGATVITWMAVILGLVLVGGFYLIYRLVAGQTELARQQQDFVSAVSHELKTPLTSIRMYGEILREGWATEEKKKTYYDYIHDESERLSRLISNVLQLARMTRNDVHVDMKPMTVAELMDNAKSKISSQIERAGFALNARTEAKAAQSVIDVDADGFSQIIINLVDNALKFSSKAENKTIDFNCRRLSDGTIEFSVRDYGPGIAKDQMKKIFRLFYRSENELTRETVGTGIGLALAHELAVTMKAKLDVVNREPGAEFRVSFVAKKES